MNSLNVLLVCGSGISSGFIAANMREEAAKQGVELIVTARSEMEIEKYIDKVNCIMLGPHFSFLYEGLKKQYKNKNIVIAVMEKKYYSTLDGFAAFKHIQSLFEGSVIQKSEVNE